MGFPDESDQDQSVGLLSSDPSELQDLQFGAEVTASKRQILYLRLGLVASIIINVAALLLFLILSSRTEAQKHDLVYSKSSMPCRRHAWYDAQ